jgi:hypothetical protein
LPEWPETAYPFCREIRFQYETLKLPANIDGRVRIISYPAAGQNDLMSRITICSPA